jgi:hypothetical protein
LSFAALTRQQNDNVPEYDKSCLGRSAGGTLPIPLTGTNFRQTSKIMKPRQTIDKRRKEALRQERKREKAERRQQRREERAQRPERGTLSEDPDLADIVWGPQPAEDDPPDAVGVGVVAADVSRSRSRSNP